MELKNCKLVLQENIKIFFFPEPLTIKTFLSYLSTLVQHLMVHVFLHCLLGEAVVGGACCMSKDKAVPLQAWSGPQGSRKLRFSEFMTTAQDGGKVVSLTHRPPLLPGNTPGTNFC